MKNELIYGFHAVKMVLQTRPRDVIQLFVQAGRRDQRMSELIAMADMMHIQCDELSKIKLQDIVGESNLHQGIVARCKPLAPWTESELMSCIKGTTDRVLLLVLDGVQDPHNLGACL